MSKVTVVGAGNVGATCANVLAFKEVADEVVLLDIKEGISEGKSLDMMQTAALLGFDSRIVGVTNDYSKTKDSDVVVVTSGIPRKPGMTREELIGVNAGIVTLLTVGTLMIIIFGLLAFIFDTACGVFFIKIANIFIKKENRINPLIGGAGISAFPMSSRVVQKVGQQANKQNHLLPFALGANVAGQIGSVLAGGLLLTLLQGGIG